MEIRTYYDILDVSFNCNEKDIRKAFKLKSLELHPDKCKVSDGHLFSEMKQAYDTLVDRTSRTAYDLLNNIRFIESHRILLRQREEKKKIDKTAQEKELENQYRIREVQAMKLRMDEILKNEKEELLKAKIAKDLVDQQEMVNEMKREIEELQRIEREQILKDETSKDLEENKKKQQAEKIRLEQEDRRRKQETMLNLKLMKKQEILLRKEIKQNVKWEAQQIRLESQLNKIKETSPKKQAKTNKIAKEKVDKENKTKKTVRSKSKAERMCQRMKSKSFYYSASIDSTF